MKAYFGSKISQNQTMTPDGFLIAHNVPIARSGWYKYLAHEIGLNGDDEIDVHRDPDEVFSPAAMASFEGKPVTNNHPPEGVMPQNATTYTKGSTSNVRRGKGDDEDLLLADLIIYDQQLIDDIKNGKREVSAGYECDYKDNGDGTYSQSGIVGNHVAVVESGRAGDRVRINDHKSNDTKEPEKTKARDSRMANKTKLPMRKPSRMTNFLAAVGLKTFAMDAEPDEVMDAMDAYAEERGTEDGNDFPVPTNQENKCEDAEPEDVQGIEAIRKQMEALTALVQHALASKAEDEDPEKAIDAAIAQMEDPEETPGEEDSHTIEPTNDDEGPVTEPEDRPKDGFTAKDSAVVAFLRKMKPAIAAIKDPAEKKRVADAALAAVKGRPARPSSAYADIKNSVRKKATDKQTEQQKQEDQSKLGQEWARKYNPHYKGRA